MGRLHSPLRLRDQRGFTLIELLVAMIAGLVITGALLAILEVSLRQNARISDRVQADRTGRTALTNMLDELQSSCTGFGSGSIQPPTTTPTSPLATTGPLNLWFLTAYGSATSGTSAPAGVTLHDINWSFTKTSNTSKQLGRLTDYSWNSTGGAPPTSPWTFNSTLSAATAGKVRVVAENVVPVGGSAVFSYEQYDTNPADTDPAATKQYGKLAPFAPAEFPLTSVTSRKVAKVSLAYEQAPSSGDTRPGHTTSFSGGVNLRLTPTESRGEGTTCT